MTVAATSPFAARSEHCRRVGSWSLGGIAHGPGNPVATVHLLDRSHVIVVKVEAEDVGVLADAVGVGALRKHRIPLLDGPAQQDLRLAHTVGDGCDRVVAE